jgi:hypothetical protein
MTECTVCCCEIEGRGRTILSCGHEFHLQCISTWLSQKGGRTCPVCRAQPSEKEQLYNIDPNPTVSRLVNGVTQLMFAATNNDSVATRSLITSGEDLDARDGDGDTPLVYSVSNRHEDITKLLVAAGADLTSISKLVAAPQTPDGALAAAVSFYSPACVTKLLTKRVTLEGVERAREIAINKNYMDLAYLLMVKRDELKPRTCWTPWKTSVFQ